MPSPMCAIACRDPGYQTALNAKGFALTDTVKYNGVTYSHADIAATFDESYQRHRPNQFNAICGGVARSTRKLQRQFDRAVKSDVYGSFGISGWTIGFAILLGVLGGPFGLVVAIVTVLFQYYLERDLRNDETMTIAMGLA